MSYELISYPDYLAHYGIKGQKWGVRRFQNEDGSLTAAGKEHYYSKGLDKTFKKESKKLAKYERNADESYQMQKEAYHKQKAAKNARKAAVDAGVAVGATLGVNKAIGENNNQMLRIMEPEMYALKEYAQKGVGAVFGVSAAVRAGKAAYHGLAAANAHRKASEVGHAKAVQKYQKQINKMTKMFADTPYSELIEK